MDAHDDRTAATRQFGGKELRRLDAGSVVRFVVEDSSGREFSLSRGFLTFKAEGCLGEGGQGNVMRARELRPDDGTAAADGTRAYALKEYAARDVAAAEWEMLYAHRDERTIPRPYVYGYFQVQEQGVWLPDRHWAVVMELVSGEALSELLRDGARRKRLSAEEALVMMAPVLEWLSNACRNSWRRDVHRDIKPHNIIREPGGTVRLIDFGIASNAALSRAQRGTRGYAAPELYGLDADADLNDQRIDTYGAAATLYALLCQGKPPAYGIGVDQAQENVLRHGDELADVLTARLRQRLADAFGVVLPAPDLRHALDSTVREEDLHILEILARGLSARQSERPDPAEFESLLRPYTSPGAYEDAVFRRAIARALQVSQRAEETSLAPDAVENDDRDFIVALDAFNRGRYNKALPILRKQSELKNTSAMYYYGVCVRDGLGSVERSYERAAALFSEAALQGNLLAQNALGHMLLEGTGVPRNEAKGIEWLRRSARNDEAAGRVGFRPAQEWLEAHDIGY